MKTRNGFVSNSSSSSYVCDICGDVTTGYNGDGDTKPSCTEGHTFCEKHAIKSGFTFEQKKIIIIESQDTGTQEELDKINELPESRIETLFKQAMKEDYEVSTLRCPICQMKQLSDNDLINYLLYKLTTTRKEICTEIRNNFKIYRDFQNFLKENKPKKT